MPMTYTDGIQAATCEHKMRLLLESIIESACDNDEALDKRDPESLEHQVGFTVSLPGCLGFYESTGTGTPLLDRRIKGYQDTQAAEWARQYPHRAPLYECAGDEDSEFASEAEEWELAALEGETVWFRVEITRDRYGEVKIEAAFTDDCNAPIGEEYRERFTESEFLAMEGEELEPLCSQIAEAPYCDIVTKENSGGAWHSWFGTECGRVAHFNTGGHATEADARRAVERAMRY